MKKVVITVLALISFKLYASESQLAKVLIIGDSISIGYTAYVVTNLKGEAVVKHNQGNAGPTMRGVEQIEKWLGDTKWDVIHFNWGLWDMYGWRYEKVDRSPKAYEKRLESLVLRLKKTGAKLIWGTTTPICPEPEKKCKVMISPTYEQEYLASAIRVMKKNSIPINDLHALMSPVREKYAIASNDVHYTKNGYEKLAKQVTDKIKQLIKATEELPANN